MKSKEIKPLSNEDSLISLKKNIDIISKICEKHNLNLAKIKSSKFIEVPGYSTDDDETFDGFNAFSCKQLPVTEKTKITAASTFNDWDDYGEASFSIHLYNEYEVTHNKRQYVIKIYLDEWTDKDGFGTELFCMGEPEYDDYENSYDPSASFTKHYDKAMVTLSQQARLEINTAIIKIIEDQKISNFAGKVPDKIKKLLNFS